VLHTKAKILSIAVSTSLLLTACNQDVSSTQGEGFNGGSGSSNNTNTDFNQLALVISLTDDIISPTFENFQVEAAEQQASVIAYCNSEKDFANNTVDQSVVDLAKMSAQTQWRATMDVWQQAEVMQLGPL
jgi:predicted lipoprotein